MLLISVAASASKVEIPKRYLILKLFFDYHLINATLQFSIVTNGLQLRFFLIAFLYIE